MRVAVASVVVGLMLVFSGCSFSIGGSTVKQSEAENFVKKNVPKLLADTEFADSTVSDASCPKDVKVEEGKSFDCDVTLNTGETGTATVHMENVDGDKFEYRMGPDDVVQNP